jgi:hypothetical protein
MTKAAVAKTWSLTVGGDGLRRSKPPADTLPPTVPVITASSVLSSSAVSITVSPSTDSQSGVKEYVFKYRLSGGSTYLEDGRVPHTGGTVTREIDALTPSTAYQFVVSAVDDSPNLNESANSTAVTLTTSAGAPPTGFAPTFPRSALIAIGNPQTYPSTWSTAYGKYDIVIMNGGWEGWATGRGYTRQSVVTGIKAASVAPAGTLVFQYTNIGEMSPTAPSYQGYFNECSARNWWVYNSGTSGTKTPSNFNAAYWLVNYTDFTPTNPSGLHPYEFAAVYWDQLFRGTGGVYDAGMAAASMDGPFVDNMLLNPQASGDWDRAGTADTFTNSTSGVGLWLQAGQKRFCDKLRTLIPSTKYLIGNIGDYGRYGVSTMNQVLNGGLYEAAMGRTYSAEYFSSFQSMLTRYRGVVDAVKAPKLVVFGVVVPNGTSYSDARYGICAGLMDDGYVAVNRADTIGYTADPATFVNWDELMGGTLNTRGYLGAPLDPRQTAARYQAGTDGSGSGIWRRDFTNGIVLCAARRGVGSLATVSQSTSYSAQALGGTFYPLRGVLDTTVNNHGAGITSITMAPRTGRILMRTAQ